MCERPSGDYEMTVAAFGLTEAEWEALFDRVADAAHALDEQVTCSGGPAAEKDAATYSETRFACHCGRFLAESAIRYTDHRDDSRYYGIRTEVEWDCGRCGTVKGEEWEPQMVVTATRVIPLGSGATTETS